MKKLIILVVMTLFLSCSTDDADCQKKINEINEKYEIEVQMVMDSNMSAESKEFKINALTVERNKRIESAC